MKYQEVYYPTGPVFMCLNGFISFIGGTGWSNESELVACRHLGVHLLQVHNHSNGNKSAVNCVYKTNPLI